jgi:hypothetical protein
MTKSANWGLLTLVLLVVERGIPMPGNGYFGDNILAMRLNFQSSVCTCVDKGGCLL